MRIFLSKKNDLASQGRNHEYFSGKQKRKNMVKTVAENWDSKAPFAWTILAYRDRVELVSKLDTNSRPGIDLVVSDLAYHW